MSKVRSVVVSPAGWPVATTLWFDVRATTTLALETTPVHVQVISGR